MRKWLLHKGKMVFRIKRWISNSYLTRRSNYGYRCESDMLLYQWKGIWNYVHFPFKCYLKGTVNQGNKTRKGNGCCVVSAYILKPVLNQFVNKNFENFDNSHNSFLWQEYFIDFFLCKRRIPCQTVTSVLCLLYIPETVHWSAENVK